MTNSTKNSLLKELLEHYSINFVLDKVLPKEHLLLWREIEQFGKENRIPAIREDVGGLLSFMTTLLRPKRIFEFGSGVGHSAFWFFAQGHEFLEKVYLTEYKDALWEPFHSFSWPPEWKEKIFYHQGDAFDLFQEVEEVDLIFIDGQKSQYLPFFQLAERKLSERGVIIVDNVFWKGNVLDDETKDIKKMSYLSVKGIRDFVNYLDNHPWKKTFIPIDDGVLLLHRP